MARLLKTALQSANIPLLDQQLKAALSVKCYGVTADFTGVYVVLADDASNGDEGTALSVCAAHDPEVDTAEQAAAKVGKIDIAALLAQADIALSDLVTKKATFQSGQTLQNAAPLLLEVTTDLIAIIKALKYVVNTIN